MTRAREREKKMSRKFSSSFYSEENVIAGNILSFSLSLSVFFVLALTEQEKEKAPLQLITPTFNQMRSCFRMI